MKTALLSALLALNAMGQAARLQVPSFGPDLSALTLSSLDGGDAQHHQPPVLMQYWTPASRAHPTTIATRFLRELLPVGAMEAAGFSFMVKNNYTTDHNGVHHVYFKQLIHGKEVVNADANVHVDRFGRVFSYSSSFFTEALQQEEQNDQHQMVLGTGPLSPREAVVKFSEFLSMSQIPSVAELEERVQIVARAEGAEHPEWMTIVTNVPFAAENQVELAEKYLIVMEPLPRLVRVWDVNCDMKSGDNWFSAQLDMIDGKVLQVVDWVRESAYVVYPIGVNDPDDGDRSLVINPEDKLASPLGWHDQGHAGRNRGDHGKFRTTVGNNVWAQNNPNGRSSYENNYRPTGAGAEGNLTFNNDLDLTKEPSEYADAAITNLFYWNNVMHDLFYQYGFDEKAGNFQEDNFDRGGKGGDAVIANAQDGSGVNNANFATPPDGQKGRMRMYVWTLTKPQRDGDFESGIVIHEYGHGISTRLTGGPANSNCLGFGEAGGMGEGWGDFWAIALRMRSTYNSSTAFEMGNYAAGRGIRPFPYSTSMDVNPHTYSWLKKPRYGEVHAIGAVWAEMLYELYWVFVDKYGFNPDWYSVTNDRKAGQPLAGNIVIMQLVVDGLKLQPCRPTFIDARNAIIKADEVSFDGEHVCMLWKTFAKRGLGFNAKPRGNEDFAVPQECQ